MDLPSIQTLMHLAILAVVASASLRGSTENDLTDVVEVEVPRLLAEDGETEIKEGPVMALRAEFTYQEDCESYNLPFCITANNTDAPYSHLRMVLRDQVWWFEDHVTVEAKQFYRNQRLEWEVRAVVNFGHDSNRHVRSRVYTSLVLDEPRTILSWMEYNYYHETGVTDDCHTNRQESLNTPQTHLVKEIAAVSPLLFFNNESEASSMRESSGMTTAPVAEVRTGTFGVVADLSNYTDDPDIENPEETFVQAEAVTGPNYLYGEIDPVDITNEAEIWEENFFLANCSDTSVSQAKVVGSTAGIASRAGLNIYSIPQQTFKPVNVSIKAQALNETLRRMLKWKSSTSDEWIQQLGETLLKGKPPAEWIEEQNPLKHLTILKDFLGLPITSDEIEQKYQQVLPDYFKATGLPNTEATIAGLDEVGTTLDEITGKTIALEPKLLKVYDALLKLLKVESHTTTVKDALGTVLISLDLLKFVPYVKTWVPIIQLPLKQIKGVVDIGAKPLKAAGDSLRSYDVKGKLRNTLAVNEQIGITVSRAAITTNFVAKPTFTLLKHCKNVDAALAPMVNTVQKIKDLLSKLWPNLNLNLLNFPDFSAIFDALKIPADILDKVLTLFDPIIEVLNKFKAALNQRITVNVPGPFCSVQKRVCVALPCGVRKCNSRVFCGWRRRGWRLERRYCTVRVPCGVKFCQHCSYVKLPSWCTKSFSFTIQQILDGISGLISIVFKPLEMLMNAILSAIDLPQLTIPGLNLNLPFMDFVNKMKKALDDLVNWLEFSLPKIGFPSCTSNLLDVTPFYTPNSGTKLLGLYRQNFFCTEWDFLKPNFCQQSFDSIVCQQEQCPVS